MSHSWFEYRRPLLVFLLVNLGLVFLPRRVCLLIQISSVLHFLAVLSPMASIRRPNVFVNDHNQVYSSPNAAHLPAIPLVDCDIDNPQDTFVPHWANVVRPELPFTPIEFDMSNYIISRLAVPPSHPLPVQQTPDGSWELDREHQERWCTLEKSLIYIIAKFRKTHHSLFSLDYRPYRNPSDHGYLRSHKAAKHAQISATQSRLAFLPLIGRVSYELSRVDTHVWVKALLNDNGNPVHQSWIDAIKNCALGNFSPSIRRAGALINLGSPNPDVLELVPRMIKCNVPVWFFWGSYKSPCPFTGGPSIDIYCPSQREIDEALVTRQITVNPTPTSDAIFPLTESFVPPSSVDPFAVALSSSLSSQPVSSFVCLNSISDPYPVCSHHLPPRLQLSTRPQP